MNSNDHLRDERLEEVVSYFRRMKVPTRPLDVDVLASLHIRYEVASQSPPFPLSSRRRYLTHIVIPSAAASLLFVSGLGIFSLQSTSGLALADVLEATETHKLVRYKMEQSTQTIGMTGRTQNTVYLDLETPRARTESQFREEGEEAVLIDLQDIDRHLMTNSKKRSAWVGPGNKELKKGLTWLLEFQEKKEVVASKDNIDGRVLFKYRLEEGRNVTQIWVDARSKLPVQMEHVMIDPTPDIILNKFIMTDFEWDPRLPSGFKDKDEFFSTQLPDGYTFEGPPNANK